MVAEWKKWENLKIKSKWDIDDYSDTKTGRDRFIKNSKDAGFTDKQILDFMIGNGTVIDRKLLKGKKIYYYYASDYPLDMNRASTEGSLIMNNLEEVKKNLNRHFKYFVIFSDAEGRNGLYIRKGRWNG